MFKRYAIFYCPTGPLAAFGAAWLGWDSANSQRAEHPDIGGIDIPALTKKPRQYGFHGTLKAPFHLAPEHTLDDLRQLACDFAANHDAIHIGPLSLRHQNGFIGLRPSGQPPALHAFAAELVRAFDRLRAPMSDADITRRRTTRLTPRQDAQMLQWGYPFIFDDFHFHLTLTGRVKPPVADQTITALAPHILPLLPDPFMVEAITLVGQGADGMFHQIERFQLAGEKA